MPISFVSIKEVPWDILSPGIHQLTLVNFRNMFVFNDIRRKQFHGLIRGLQSLKLAGCSIVYIDGSYVTKKPNPGDYDACWEHTNVDIPKLDEVFVDFTDERAAQKNKYEGEFFPAYTAADSYGNIFLNFFQIEKNSGQAKGIIQLNLDMEDLNMFSEEL
jgi:hypothetical protein